MKISMRGSFFLIFRKVLIFCVCLLTICGCAGSSDSGPSEISVANDSDNQASVLVNFDITVPALQSDALRLELVWGEKTLTASWVGDEYWSASGEFQSGIEQLLTVTFYDRNGELALAKYSRVFEAGYSETESFQILADQFNAVQFDDDGDGVSNLQELIEGTDPELDEDSLLEIRDFFTLPDNSRSSIATWLEGWISDDRPFSETIERFPEPGGYPGTYSRVIDIDVNGNGTLTLNEYLLGTVFELSVTRTTTENSIAWEGSRIDNDGDYNHTVSFTNSVTAIDETTRRFYEETVGRNSGTYDYRWNFTFDLTGRLMEESNLCEPVSGMVSINQWAYMTHGVSTNNVITISKEAAQPYWRVATVSSVDGASEYFVQELRDFRTFICDFVDI